MKNCKKESKFLGRYTDINRSADIQTSASIMQFLEMVQWKCFS